MPVSCEATRVCICGGHAAIVTVVLARRLWCMGSATSSPHDSSTAPTWVPSISRYATAALLVASDSKILFSGSAVDPSVLLRGLLPVSYRVFLTVPHWISAWRLACSP
jgi:hypothetical protein